MELHAHHVSALHSCCEGFNVLRNRGCIRSDGSFVRMREVDKLAWLDAGEKPRTRSNFERIPAHVRNLLDAFGKARARFGKCPRPGCCGASVDPEYSHCMPTQMPRNGTPRAIAARIAPVKPSRIEPLGRRKVADARQHDALRRFNQRQDRRL